MNALTEHSAVVYFGGTEKEHITAKGVVNIVAFVKYRSKPVCKHNVELEFVVNIKLGIGFGEKAFIVLENHRVDILVKL